MIGDLEVKVWDEDGERDDLDRPMDESQFLIDDLLVATSVWSDSSGEEWTVENIDRVVDEDSPHREMHAWRLTRNEEQVVKGSLRDLAYWWNGYMEAKGEA